MITYKLGYLQLNLLKANFYLNCVQVFSPYRAVNILRLGYKNQSINAV